MSLLFPSAREREPPECPHIALSLVLVNSKHYAPTEC